jgi:hypothetical protein
MVMISYKLNLVLIIILIGGSFNDLRVSSAAANLTETCNGICGGLTLSYPFGFSLGCPIQFNCSAAGQGAKIGEFPVQNVTENSILVGVPTNCTRKIEDMTPLFGKQFTPSSENSFLMENCVNPTNGCSINQRFLDKQLKSCESTGNISCFPSDTSSKSSEFLSMKELTNSSCRLLYTSIALESVGVNVGIAVEFERVRLGWWLMGGCENGTCVVNANCTDVYTPDGYAGHRCSCLEGYHGDGYINPCLKLRGQPLGYHGSWPTFALSHCLPFLYSHKPFDDLSAALLEE